MFRSTRRTVSHSTLLLSRPAMTSSASNSLFDSAGGLLQRATEHRGLHATRSTRQMLNRRFSSIPGQVPRPGEFYLAPLHSRGEIFEVLAHHALRIGYRVGDDLTYFTARGVGVVHRHLDAGPVGSDFLEAHLA